MEKIDWFKGNMDICYKIGGRWYIYQTVFCEEEMVCSIRNAYKIDGVTEVKTKWQKRKEA